MVSFLQRLVFAYGLVARKFGEGLKLTCCIIEGFKCLEGCLWDIGRVFIAGMMIVASSPVMR